MKTIKELFNEAFSLLIEKENDTTIDYYFLVNNVIQFRCTYILRYTLKDPDKLLYVINILNQIVTIDPNHKNIYEFIAIATKYFDVEKGLEIAKKGLEIEPESAYLNYRLGLMYFAKAEYQKSLFYFKQAYNLDEANPIFIKKIGYTYLKLKDYVNSKLYFRYLLMYNPEDFDSYYYRGIIYYEQENYIVARSLFVDANNIKEGNEKLLFKLVYCYSKTKYAESGLNFANELIERFPNSWNSYFAKILILEKINSKKEVLDFYEYALNQNIDHKYLVPTYVHDCSILASYERGLKTIDKLLKINPFDYMWVYNRACMNFGLNKFQEALNDLDIVIEKQPKIIFASNLKEKIIRSLN